MSSFTAHSDLERKQEGLFASARQAAGINVGGQSPVTLRDLQNLASARQGLAKMGVSSDLQQPATQKYSPHYHYQNQKGFIAPTTRFMGRQVIDAGVSALLNTAVPGLGFAYGVGSLIHQAQTGAMKSGIMPSAPAKQGSIFGAAIGSFADEADRARNITPSRFAPKGNIPNLTQKFIPAEPSSGQQKTFETVNYFTKILDRKAADLSALSQGSHLDLLNPDIMSEDAWRKMNPHDMIGIQRNYGYGNLTDTGLSQRSIQYAITPTAAPAPAFG